MSFHSRKLIRQFANRAAQSKLISEGIKGSKLVIVPGANHSVSHEQPELFIATIREFIGRRATESGQSSVEDSL